MITLSDRAYKSSYRLYIGVVSGLDEELLLRFVKLIIVLTQWPDEYLGELGLQWDEVAVQIIKMRLVSRA